ncbi:S-adenosyl-L-methionine-dependent methyltransferase, partial [Clavulina sp. PMI_390]
TRTSEEDDKSPYDHIRIYGEDIQVGDFVFTRHNPDDDHDRARQERATGAHAQTDNPLLRNYWIYQVQAFALNDEGIEFHGLALDRAACTLLEGLALFRPQELVFLDGECDTHPVAAIMGKARVTVLRQESHPPPDPIASNEFFVRWNYRSWNGRFEDICFTLDDLLHTCPACQRRRNLQERESISISNDHPPTNEGFVIGNMPFHLQDFCYFPPETQGSKNPEPFRIGQIIALPEHAHSSSPASSQIHVTVRWLVRSRDLPELDSRCLSPSPRHASSHPRRLYQTLLEDNMDIEDVAGKCHVLRRCQLGPLTDLDDLPPHFFYVKEDGLEQCEGCDNAWNDAQDGISEYLKSNGPRPMGEVFCGIGGFSTGLEQSKFFKSFWGIEINRDAAEIYEDNHNARVYVHSVNDVLERLLLGECVLPLKDIRDKMEIREELTAQPEQVELLAAGFPWQVQRKFEQMTVVAALVSLVGEIRPKIVVLENVDGLLYDNLANDYLVVLKFIHCGLLEYGYQVQAELLHSAAHGVPQTRRRLFIIAVQSGNTLPFFPQPSHAYPTGGLGMKLPASESHAYYRDGALTQPDGAAPLPMVTLEEALRDTSGYRPEQSTLLAPTLLASHRAFEDLSLNQMRIIQGFPHEFKFEAAEKHVISGLGNAVAPPVARAIGEAIGKALVKDWCIQTGRQVPEALFWND